MMGFILQFKHRAVVKCFVVLEEHALSTFRVTKLGHMYVDFIWRKRCISFIRRFEGVWPVTAIEGGKRYSENN
jgi:hypothetical protein